MPRKVSTNPIADSERIECTEDHPFNAQGPSTPGTFSACANSLLPPKEFTVEALFPELEVTNPSGDGKELQLFDLNGVPASFANALRRIMLAEVPTMAIETVWFYDNTSVIPDEMLAHRMGLLPIVVDPNDFEYLHEQKVSQEQQEEPEEESEEDSENEFNDMNTLLFKLDVTCTEVRDDSTGEMKIQHSTVYSGDFVWEPQGSQDETYEANPPHFVSDKIIIAKLRPGQHIQCDCYVHKGIGKDHAKFSPVGTASYRLLPDVQVKSFPKDKKPEDLVKLCPLGVFDIEDGGVVVKKPRNCTMCRNCVRHEFGFDECVSLARIRQHHIFSVESVGQINAREIVVRSLDVLDSKCEKIINALDNL